jgi:hypothetical protein
MSRDSIFFVAFCSDMKALIFRFLAIEIAAVNWHELDRGSDEPSEQLVLYA